MFILSYYVYILLIMSTSCIIKIFSKKFQFVLTVWST